VLNSIISLLNKDIQYFHESDYQNSDDLKMEMLQSDLIKSKIRKDSKNKLKLLKEHQLKYNNTLNKWETFNIIFL